MVRSGYAAHVDRPEWVAKTARRADDTIEVTPNVEATTERNPTETDAGTHEPFLFGDHEIAIDDKNRLLVPADLRRALDPALHGTAFLVTTGQNKRPWLYPELYYQKLVSRRPQTVARSSKEHRRDLMYFARFTRVVPDKQGRILLPEKILRRCETPKEVTLLGVRDHLEIWSRQDWQAEDERLQDGWDEAMDELLD